MNKSSLIASALTFLFVLGLVIYRLPWAGSQLTAAVGLGRFPKAPKTLRRLLFGEHNDTSAK
jgi:hypothetical protein